MVMIFRKRATVDNDIEKGNVKKIRHSNYSNGMEAEIKRLWHKNDWDGDGDSDGDTRGHGHRIMLTRRWMEVKVMVPVKIQALIFILFFYPTYESDAIGIQVYNLDTKVVSTLLSWWPGFHCRCVCHPTSICVARCQPCRGIGCLVWW